MSYDSVERSNYSGKPIKLYSFNIGPNEWTYTSNEEDVPLGGVTYIATQVSDNGIRQSGEVAQDTFVVKLGTGAEFLQLFISTPPSVEMYLTVRDFNRGETEAPVVGVYLVRSAKRISQLSWEVTCAPLTASLNRNGLRLPWGRSCPHVLYDQNCRVVASTKRVTLTVDGLTGISIISSGVDPLDENYLAGGYIEWEWLPGVMERRAIENSSGSVILLLDSTFGLEEGQEIFAYPGCNRTIKMCDERFDNVPNYGGYPHMPGESPFDGDTIVF